MPRLADEGVYLASESTVYRVLKENDMQHHRGRSKKPNV
ncbi:transposase [Gracilibacillus boraciitolerans JCM 21714]|uniref:Transposase n=1 Tax=Gracilibacillus boraciitolerans JCM 21714 TaxID=1298598 RepID=W4VNJ7_9BACI|nr:transposase [Gracilibacillus boraciitolerans JCM 21714]